MPRIRLTILTYLLLSLSLVLPVFAQDALTQQYTSPDGQISLNYPDGWVVKTGTASADLLDVSLGNSEAAAGKDAFLGMSRLDSGEVSLHLLIGSPATLIGPIIAIEDTDDPAAFLASYVAEYNKLLRYKVSEVKELPINDLPAARLDFDGKTHGQGFIIVVRLGDHLVAMATLSTGVGELATWEATAQAILASLSDSGASQVAVESTPSPALDLTQHFVSSDNLFSFDYPADWVTDFDNREAASLDLSLATSGRVRHFDPLTRSTDKFAPDEARINILSGEKADLVKRANLAEDAEIADILTALLSRANSSTASFEPVEAITSSSYPTARAFFTVPALADGYVLMVDFGSGIIGITSVYYAPGERSRWDAAMQAIIASMHYGETPEATPESTTSPALELDATYTSDDGSVSFDYPSAWAAIGDTYFGRPSVTLGNSRDMLDKLPSQNAFTSGDFIIDFVFTEENPNVQVPGLTPDSSPAEILRLAMKAYTSPEAESSLGKPPEDTVIGEVIERDILGEPGAAVHIQDGNRRDGVFMLFRYRPHLFCFITIAAAPGEAAKWQETALAILATITLNEIPTPEATESAG